MSWQVVPGGVSESLSGISGSAADDVWIVGASGRVLRWNGSALVQVASHTTIDFSEVSGAAANEVWAVGGGVARWNGTSWARDATLSGSYSSVAASGRGGAWVVGASGAAQRWNGATCTPVPALTSYALNAMWAVSLVDVRAVGMSSTVLRGH